MTSVIDFRRIARKSPNSYIVLDPELRIVWANDSYLALTGRALSDIEGLAMFDAFPSQGESHRQLQDSFDRVLETGLPDEIAYIRYDIANGDGTFDVRYWSASHTPLLDSDGEVAHILQHTTDVTEIANLRHSADAAGMVKRAQMVERRATAAAADAGKLRIFFEQAPGFVAVLTGAEHRFTMTNAAYRRLLGERELLGLTVREAIPEVVSQGFVGVLDEVLRAGEPYFGQREHVMLIDPADGTEKDLVLEFIFQPIRDADGVTTGIIIQGYDVTEESEAEERQRILINELNHRVKNTLAVVQGLAQQSFRDDLESNQLDTFNARLAALAGAHNLLTERSWTSADLRAVICSIMAATFATEESRYTLRGPQITLTPQAAVALAMCVHELATNALKYGALSNDEGHVAVDWKRMAGEHGEMLEFEWTETGGPPVTEPPRRGFGTRLIGRGLGGRNDRTTLEYRPQGLYCRIEAVL